MATECRGTQSEPIALETRLLPTPPKPVFGIVRGVVLAGLVKGDDVAVEVEKALVNGDDCFEFAAGSIHIVDGVSQGWGDVRGGIDPNHEGLVIKGLPVAFESLQRIYDYLLLKPNMCYGHDVPWEKGHALQNIISLVTSDSCIKGYLFQEPSG